MEHKSSDLAASSSSPLRLIGPPSHREACVGEAHATDCAGNGCWCRVYTIGVASGVVFRQPTPRFALALGRRLRKFGSHVRDAHFECLVFAVPFFLFFFYFARDVCGLLIGREGLDAPPRFGSEVVVAALLLIREGTERKWQPRAVFPALEARRSC